MRKTVAALTAGAVIVTGAAIASAQSDEEAPSTDSAVEEPRSARGRVLSGVLDELVTAGTITQEQADAILEALQAKRDEFRETRTANRQALRELLADGVLTAEELEQFPEWHPLRDPNGPAAPYLEDGQLTTEELAEIRFELKEARGFGRVPPLTEPSDEG